jgi:SNF2 family DNA or RNA helicase
MEKEDCPICMCELENPVLLPCCQHLFCGGCILKCSETKNSCPMCRSVIHFQNVTSIVSKDKHSKKDTRYIPNKPKSKQDCLIDLIKRELQYNPRKKFIVFSSYDETFDLIRNDFKTGDISFVELTGTKAMKNKRLNSYRNGDTSVIFLNSKTNCAGINLQETTDIILYHDMDEMYETQIIGRANRIGRKEDLTVHRFIYV